MTTKNEAGENNKKVSVEVLIRKRENATNLLSKWKRKVQSAQKKIKRYKMNKKKFTKEISVLSRH